MTIIRLSRLALYINLFLIIIIPLFANVEISASVNDASLDDPKNTQENEVRSADDDYLSSDPTLSNDELSNHHDLQRNDKTDQSEAVSKESASDSQENSGDLSDEESVQSNSASHNDDNSIGSNSQNDQRIHIESNRRDRQLHDRTQTIKTNNKTEENLNDETSETSQNYTEEHTSTSQNKKNAKNISEIETNTVLDEGESSSQSIEIESTENSEDHQENNKASKSDEIEENLQNSKSLDASDDQYQAKVNGIDQDTLQEMNSKEGDAIGIDLKDLPNEKNQSIRVNDKEKEEDDGLKERVVVNYAHKSAGAIVLEKSSSFKGTSNLLTSDNDKYAITPCDEKKNVVIGLSEDILVKQIVLANFERFSSHVKDFQVLGSQTYPIGNWHDLGTYTAKPGNGIQTFDLKEPSWARYLQFKFLSHYGEEHYCTVSQIKVHGSTMLQGFHEQWTQSEKETKERLDEEKEILEENDSISQLNSEEFASEENKNESANDAVEETQIIKESDHYELEQESVTQNSKDVGNDDIDENNRLTSSTVSSNSQGKNDANSSDSQATLNFDGEDTEVNISSDRVVTYQASNFGDLEIPVEENAKFTKGENQISESSEYSTYDSANKVALPNSSVLIETKGTTKIDMNIEETEDKDSKEEYQSNFEKLVVGGAFSDAVNKIKEGTITVSDAVKKMTEGNSVSYDTVKNLTKMVKDAVLNQLDDQKKEIDWEKNVNIAAHDDESKISNKSEIESIENDVANREEEALAMNNEIKTVETAQKTEPNSDSVKENLESNVHVDEVQSDKSDLSIKASSPDLQSDNVKINSDPVLNKESPKQIPANDMNQRNLNAGTLSTNSIPGSNIIKSSSSNIRNNSKSSLPSSNTGPGINCFDLINNLNELKAKRSAQKQAKMNPMSASGIEPIFKTLTDEIKALQLHQSIYEEFVTEVVDCFQTVTAKMSKEIEKLEENQDQRISNLENFMNDFIEKQEKTYSYANISGISSITLATAASNSIRFFLSKAIPASKFFAKYFREEIFPSTEKFLEYVISNLLHATKVLITWLTANFLKYLVHGINEAQSHGYLSGLEIKAVENTFETWLNNSSEHEGAILGIIISMIIWRLRPRRRGKSNKRIKKKGKKKLIIHEEGIKKESDTSQKGKKEKKPRIKIEE